jgi:Spy/CpxP family protein refolding chaperone
MATRHAVALAALASLATSAPAAAAPVPDIAATAEVSPPSAPAAHGQHRGMWRPHRGRIGPVSFLLRHRAELALSTQQVVRLEQLRLDATRDLIRRGADLRVAELELAALRRAEPVDLAQVEPKLRDIERMRTEFRLARIRATEAAKAQLTPDQRSKLRTLLDERARHHRPRGAAAPTPA